MNILILSCDTGGGHNAAGLAVLEELQRRGHQAEMLDPFHLSDNLIARNVGPFYVRLVQRKPRLFGIFYSLGALVTELPFSSPVYYANGKMANLMTAYFQEHPVDVVAAPHLFPAEILTYMKRKGIPCPKCLFIATDYACIPFTEETDCDYYIIPHISLSKKFIRRGIDPDKLKPLGIPVRSAFTAGVTKAEARKQLHLPSGVLCSLVAGGSMGAGKVKKLLKYLTQDLDSQDQVIVICGKNDSLKASLERLYRSAANVAILGVTSQMALYMRACDILYSKPGGLTSTEAAVTGIPLVHTTPIPGCETLNQKFFRKHGMSVSAKGPRRQAALGMRLVKSPKARHNMIHWQQDTIPRNATQEVCDLIEDMAKAP